MEAIRQDADVLYNCIYQTEPICLEAVKVNAESLHCINNQTLNICLESVKHYPSSYKYIRLVLHKHQINIHHLINYCIGLKQLRLPSYVLMDIIDAVLFDNKITHYIKIHKVIKINETY